MELEIEKKIKIPGNSVSEYIAIYKDILNLKLNAAGKEKLLSALKKQSFTKGVDLNYLMIPSERNGKVKEPSKDNLKTKAIEGDANVQTLNDEGYNFLSQNPVISSPELDEAEYDFLAKQLDIIHENFPFLQPIILKNGIQIESFKSAVICCDEILIDYLNTYFSDFNQKYVACSHFFKNEVDVGGSYIFIMIWPNDRKNNFGIIEKIKAISSIKYLDIKAFERKDTYWRSSHYLNDDVEDYLNLKYELPLVNSSLTLDQEKLIRKAVGSPTGFLTYRVLTGGYTGALVLEVTSVGNGNARKKFVLKIDKIDKKWDTIREEFRNFQEHVENLVLDDGKIFSAQRFEIPGLEAIKYPFASTDSVGDSQSLGQYIKKTKVNVEIKSVISKVFKNSLMRSWNSTYSLKQINLFEAFVKLDYKIRGFERIIEYQREFNYENCFDFDKLNNFFENQNNIVFCTAHGDFHVENIRVDSTSNKEDIFFIDFGRTGQYPMGIDHAALESSIRYSTLDSAFKIENLNTTDNLNFGNFSEILNSAEDKISKVNYMVSLIREHYFNSFPANHRAFAEDQYFKCLFAVSSWLMNKENLNRPYIWNILKRIYIEKFKIK